MNQPTKTRERVVATGLSFLILVVVGSTIHKTVSGGFLTVFPRGQIYGFGAAAFLYLLAGTDVGVAVRKARFLSAQLQCGAALLFLFACGSALRHVFFASAVAPIVVAAIWLSGLYSLLALFRPVSLFGAPQKE